MLKKRTHFFLNSFSNKLITNFLSLTVLKGSNFLISLLITPYIIKSVGLGNYGLISVAFSLMTFFSVITEYGFNVSATRQVSVNRNDKETLSKIISNVLWCKLILLVISVLVYLLIVFTAAALRQEWQLYLLSLTILLANVLFPVWFFQGIEDMKLLAVLSFISKIVYLVTIFSFIKEKTDYRYVNFLLGLSSLVISFTSLAIIFLKHKLRLMQPKIKSIIVELKDGFLIFISNFANLTYSSLNIILLEFITKDKELVGQYSVAERVIDIFKQILGIFSQVIYPQLCLIYINGLQSVLNFFKKNFTLFFVGIFFSSACLFVFSSGVIYFFIGHYDTAASLILKGMSFVPIILALNTPSYQILIVFNLKKSFSSVLVTGAFISLISNALLCSQFGVMGTVASVILTETFIAAALFLSLLKGIQKGYIK